MSLIILLGKNKTSGLTCNLGKMIKQWRLEFYCPCIFLFLGGGYKTSKKYCKTQCIGHTDCPDVMWWPFCRWLKWLAYLEVGTGLGIRPQDNVFLKSAYHIMRTSYRIFSKFISISVSRRMCGPPGNSFNLNRHICDVIRYTCKRERCLKFVILNMLISRALLIKRYDFSSPNLVVSRNRENWML